MTGILIIQGIVLILIGSGIARMGLSGFTSVGLPFSRTYRLRGRVGEIVGEYILFASTLTIGGGLSCIGTALLIENQKAQAGALARRAMEDARIREFADFWRSLDEGSRKTIYEMAVASAKQRPPIDSPEQMSAKFRRQCETSYEAWLQDEAQKALSTYEESNTLLEELRTPDALAQQGNAERALYAARDRLAAVCLIGDMFAISRTIDDDIKLFAAIDALDRSRQELVVAKIHYGVVLTEHTYFRGSSELFANVLRAAFSLSRECKSASDFVAASSLIYCIVVDETAKLDPDTVEGLLGRCVSYQSRAFALESDKKEHYRLLEKYLDALCEHAATTSYVEARDLHAVIEIHLSDEAIVHGFSSRIPFRYAVKLIKDHYRDGAWDSQEHETDFHRSIQLSKKSLEEVLWRRSGAKQQILAVAKRYDTELSDKLRIDFSSFEEGLQEISQQVAAIEDNLLEINPVQTMQRSYQLPADAAAIEKALESVFADQILVDSRDITVEAVLFDGPLRIELDGTVKHEDIEQLRIRRQNAGDMDYEIECLSDGVHMGVFGAQGVPSVTSRPLPNHHQFEVAFYQHIVERPDGIHTLTGRTKPTATLRLVLVVALPSKVTVDEYR